MRLLRELMLGLGDDGALGAVFSERASSGGQGSLPALGNFSSLWVFQPEARTEGPTFWESQAPTDGPQEVNESGGDIIQGGPDTAYTLTLGVNETGRINTEGDEDWFAVTLVAGQSYEFTLTGTGGTPLADPFLNLYGDNGELVHSDDDGGPGISSRLLFTPLTSGTYYISAGAYNNPNQVDTGNYQITFNTSAPQNPLDTLNIGYVFPDLTINVYFTTTGEVNSGDTALRNWTQAEINTVMAALASISAVTPLVFTQVFSTVGSDFRLSISDLGPNVLGHFFVGAGNGAFDPDGAGWSSAGMAPGSLGFATIVHEILHGLGLAHPHADTGDLQVMQGVLSDFFSYGTYLMNQGVFTTMSYNDGWVSPFGANSNLLTGSQGSPMALDIAYLQSLYGATTANTGDNTYSLTAAAGAYRAIWDTGGNDTIQFGGTQNAVIDLRPATITTAFGGGGWVSYVNGFHAGWTIANGVVIENATGGSGNDTLTGNEVANVLMGNNGNDTLVGNGGDDTLNGGGGADDMSGGLGNDTYFVDSASDTATEVAGQGVDTVFAGATYSLSANVENLTLTGSSGITATGNELNNVIIGNSGANFLFGGDGDDLIYADSLDTVVNGGNGTDWVYITDNGNVNLDAGANSVEAVFSGGGNDTINAASHTTAFYAYAGAGNDTVTGGSNNDSLFGQDGNDVLSGGNGNDVVWGEAGADQISGGDGSDTLFVDAQDTLISGGTGYDYVYFTGAGAFNIDAGAAGLEWIFSGGEADTINAATQIAGIIVYAGAGGDTVTGGSVNDVIFGQDGNDVLSGGNGNDVLWGEAGADQISGGGDSDTLFVDAQDTLISGGTGYDYVYFTGAGAFNIDAGAAGLEWIFASANADNINAATQTAAITVYAGAGGDTVTGGSGNDVIFGQDDNDIINGGDGADTLWGESGADQLSGGDGGDTLIVDVLDTLISGGAGYDFVYVTGAGNFTIDAGASGVEWIQGGAGNDTLNGASHSTAFTAYGGNGGDTITGGSSADVLFGEGGADIITGGGGGDVLIGGSGADRFVFTVGWGSDLVTDFQNGADLFDMTALAGSGVHSIADLTITTNGADVIISFNGNSFTIAGGAGLIDASDFLFG